MPTPLYALASTGAPRSSWRRPTTLTIAHLLLVALPGVAQPGGPLPGPLPLLPADNWWNVDISQAPVDPQSDALIAWIGRNRSLHPDFGGNADEAPEIYGMPYVSVAGSTPLVPVDFSYAEESDPGAPGRPPGYPIPEAAKSSARWIEGGYPGNVDAGGDRHLLLVDRDQRLLYELYDVFWNATRDRWEAGSGAVWPLDRNHRRPDGWTSADAAGLAILPGLVRHDEAYGSEPIRHAFRFTTRATNGYVFPASHRAGSTPGAPPMGARLRLRATVDLAAFPPPIRRIFQAMKTHGLILADNGSDLYITGTHDTRWDNDLLNPAFAALTADDFEVIQLGWQPTAPPPSCVGNEQTICLLDRFRVRAEFQPRQGAASPARAVPLTGRSGAFWFHDAEALELLVRVTDGCANNGRFWFSVGGVTNLLTRITVTDTGSGAVRTYQNPQGRAFRTVLDVRAFGCQGPGRAR